MHARPGPTPSQTIGPFFTCALPLPGEDRLVPDDHPGAVGLDGQVLDGAGAPVDDALVELWDAQGGRFGRSATDAAGCYRLVIAKPAALDGPDGTTQAPHLAVSVFARGLLGRLVTRLYFPDEQAANAVDPVLRTVGAERRPTLVAAAADDGRLRFDIHLQGPDETVFFAL